MEKWTSLSIYFQFCSCYYASTVLSKTQDTCTAIWISVALEAAWSAVSKPDRVCPWICHPGHWIWEPSLTAAIADFSAWPTPRCFYTKHQIAQKKNKTKKPWKELITGLWNLSAHEDRMLLSECEQWPLLIEGVKCWGPLIKHTDPEILQASLGVRLHQYPLFSWGSCSVTKITRQISVSFLQLVTDSGCGGQTAIGHRI